MLGNRQTRRIIRSSNVVSKTGYSRMQIYRLEKAGEFPKRVRLGPNSVGWVESEVDAWIDEKIQNRDAGAASV
jgi:prophage regulatory protein